VKNLPDRKTNVSDPAWLAQLGAHGLVRGCSCRRRVAAVGPGGALQLVGAVESDAHAAAALRLNG
jgi:hypothetical protein